MSSSSSTGDSLCGGKIPPEIFQTFGPAEERCEVGRIDEQNVACTITSRRHPQKTVEFCVACRGKWMRAIGIDRLARKHMDLGTVWLEQLVVRQVWMEIQCGDILKKSEFIQIAKSREWRNVSCSWYNRRTQAPFVVHRN